MPSAPPAAGIYFRKGHINDRLIDELITVKISVVIVTPLGAEEKELTFTGSDLLSVIELVIGAVTNMGVTRGLPVARTLGGDLPATVQAQAQQRSLLAEG